MPQPIPRRTLLRGTGTAIALPLLDCMAPVGRRARAAAAEAGPEAAPLRVAFLYVPNGVHMPDWTPKQEGAGFDLPQSLEPLCGVHGKFSIHSGLAQQIGRAHV